MKRGLWFSRGSPVYCTNKTDCHGITKILLKVVLDTINQTKPSTDYINYRTLMNYA